MTGLISKAVGAMRSLDAALFPATSVPKLSARITALLTTEKLVVADVGAAGGVDPRWRELGDAVRVVTFEPRTEPGMKDPSCRNFPICLGAAPGQRTLHITRFADSSSLYRINRERMNDFAVRDCFDVVEETNVAVDSLDHCLAVNPEWMPDFLKLDVEGAELDVLRGAEACLHQRTAALRVEVSFAERHMGAPLFGDVDAFLRSRGYALHALSRELMIRQNGLHTPLAQPQLVWGDAVYFLTRSEFLCRLRALAPERRPLALTRFVILLVAHRAVDYAVEILRATLAGWGFSVVTGVALG